MKKITILFAFLFVSAFTYAQIASPAASPSSKIEQAVGLTDVTIEYARPSMKGRTIFGDLVPYGKLWRTGANARTKITFSNDVTIGGKDLKKGTYALFTIPNQNQWEVILYTEYQANGAPRELDESKVAARFNTTPMVTSMARESFTIEIASLSNSGATIFLLWDKVRVPINFTVPTDKEVMANIERAMSGPSSSDFFTAAMYYYDEGKDIGKAKEWMEKAMAGNQNPAFWQLRSQSLIYAKAGDKKQAIETAKKSLAAAQAAGNADYVKMNQDSLKEWGAN
ncbi:MAG: DUF2911 domain-containing protein [Flavobacteriales bacterium]|nr:DUF2911 domain-containing protein [Flavobacteriales bacterium]